MKILLSLVLIASFNLTSISQDCENLKTGSWKVIGDQEFGDTYIKRSNDYQIEESIKNGIKLKTKITWLSECSYSLKVESIIENKYNIKFPEGYLEGEIVFKVIEQTKKYYIAKALKKGEEDFNIEIKYVKIE